MFYYAVKIGRTPGIYTTWEECKRNVIGYNNARFKKFSTQEEAEDFVGDVDENATENATENESDVYEVYTDGGAVLNLKAGCGYVILRNKQVIKTKSVRVNTPFTNVHAEVMGIYYAICSVIDIINSYDIQPLKIIFYTDNQMCIKTINEWGPNRSDEEWLNKSYAKEFKSILKRIKSIREANIIFEMHHVYGHRGNRYNEMADSLATSAMENS